MSETITERHVEQVSDDLIIEDVVTPMVPENPPSSLIF